MISILAPDPIQVDDDGLLYISPALCGWDMLASLGIDTIIDLEGGLDDCIPTAPDGCLYIYFPIFDEDLPNAARLEAVVMLGTHLVRSGHRVLSHCGMGFNRSAFVAGLILNRLGMSGESVVTRLRERRPGALFNEVFANHLLGL